MTKKDFDEAYRDTLSILLLGNDRFFANFLMQMRKTVTKEVPTAGVSITDKINLYINPNFFLSLSEMARVDLLKHECKHIYHEHINRTKHLEVDMKKEGKLANIAADASINYDLPFITKEMEGSVTVERLNQEINSNNPLLEDKQDFEYYFKTIKEIRDNNPNGNGPGEGLEPLDDHEKWTESYDSPDVVKEVIRQAVNDAVEKSGGIGNIPSDVVSAVSRLNKSTVDWKRQLRAIATNSQTIENTPTRKKRNRRYGLKMPGKKKKPNLKIVVCADTSGSMQGDRLEQVWTEIYRIKKTVASETYVVECDAEVQRVYEFDLKTKPEFKGGGGTQVQPAIDKAKELKPDLIIYLTDGDYFDKPINPKINFIWAIVGTGTKKINADFGKVIDVQISKN